MSADKWPNGDAPMAAVEPRPCDGLGLDPHNFDSGGSSRPSVRSALTTRSNWSSNFALSDSHPVKSAANRDVTTEPGATEVGTLEHGFTKVGFTKIGFAKVSVTEVGSAEVGAVEVNADKVGVFKDK